MLPLQLLPIALVALSVDDEPARVAAVAAVRVSDNISYVNVLSDCTV